MIHIDKKIDGQKNAEDDIIHLRDSGVVPEMKTTKQITERQFNKKRTDYAERQEQVFQDKATSFL